MCARGLVPTEAYTNLRDSGDHPLTRLATLADLSPLGRGKKALILTSPQRGEVASLSNAKASG